MTKVLVLCGGNSDEREVSLRSGAAVMPALQAGGFEASQLDPAARVTDYDSQLESADVVFPVLHGTGGEDGSIQAWLEERRIRYIGAGSACSRKCFDKWAYKQELVSRNLPVPQGHMVSKATFLQSQLARAPYVLKPHDGGSSVDTFIVRDPAQADAAKIADALGRRGQMLLEELITGQEITVSVLLHQALPIIEIIPPADGEFDYDNKYNGRTQELCPPRSVDQEIQRQAEKLALQIHHALGVRDMSRTDMMVGSDGRLWVLETNTIPGMTGQSLFPKSAAAGGYDMARLMKALVHEAMSRKP